MFGGVVGGFVLGLLTESLGKESRDDGLYPGQLVV